MLITSIFSVSLIFYSSNFFGIIFFVEIARKWPNFIKLFESVENELPHYKIIADRYKLRRNIKLVTVIIMSLSLSAYYPTFNLYKLILSLFVVEHVLSIGAGFYRSTLCAVANKTLNSHIEAYFRQSFPQLFYVSEFNYAKAAGAQVVNIYCTFIWNFMDVFIIVVSVGVASRFNQITYNLELHRGMIMPEVFWAYYRIRYQKLVELLRATDLVLGNLILLSFSNNLYFVCIQLLNSME